MRIYGGGVPSNAFPWGGIPHLSVPMIWTEARYNFTQDGQLVFSQTAKSGGFALPSSPVFAQGGLPSRFSQTEAARFAQTAKPGTFTKEADVSFSQGGKPSGFAQTEGASFKQDEKPSLTQTSKPRRFTA